LAGYLISKNRINEYMKRTYLGEFEEIVLLTVAAMDADGVALMHEIIAQTGRDLRLNHVHSA
jgi:PadR family transcriptional regulator PadR